MFWGGTTDERVSAMLSKFLGKYSLQEIHDQMKDNVGEVGKYIENENKIFSTKTTNDEIGNALTLADFYFPDSDPSICFEMKRGFNQDGINTHHELIENLESDTEIDFKIKDEEKEFDFQLKQYPEKFKEWSVEKVIKYINDSILPSYKYNSESNKDLIIVIVIKPEPKSNFKEVEDFDEIHKYLAKQNIKLKEINFLYNRNNEHMVWYQVFPENGHYKIPFQNLSYHEAKR